jgi:hypothetical protein
MCMQGRAEPRKRRCAPCPRNRPMLTVLFRSRLMRRFRMAIHLEDLPLTCLANPPPFRLQGPLRRPRPPERSPRLTEEIDPSGSRPVDQEMQSHAPRTRLVTTVNEPAGSLVLKESFVILPMTNSMLDWNPSSAWRRTPGRPSERAPCDRRAMEES